MDDNRFILLCLALVFAILVFAEGFVNWLLPLDCEKEIQSGYIISEECRMK